MYFHFLADNVIVLLSTGVTEIKRVHILCKIERCIHLGTHSVVQIRLYETVKRYYASNLLINNYRPETWISRHVQMLFNKIQVFIIFADEITEVKAFPCLVWFIAEIKCDFPLEQYVTCDYTCCTVKKKRMAIARTPITAESNFPRVVLYCHISLM